MPKFLLWFCLSVFPSCIGSCAPTSTISAPQQAAQPSTAEDSLKGFLQGYVKEARLDDDKTARFYFAILDLNGDGRAEALVYLVGRWWCGSGGCPLLVLAADRGSYTVVTRILITRPPIRVLSTTSNGWRDIAVWVQGGGIQHGYEAELRFDGKTYPISPANPPARRLTRKVPGETVISSSQKATPLYP